MNKTGTQPSQKLRTASFLGWHVRKTGSQPEKNTNEVQYIMSGVVSVADSDGRHLTREPGL
uniref:Pirin n=1 Tax=Mesocestoides corti TaxID=53468 RepID=A0A5K3F6V8_MESCO